MAEEDPTQPEPGDANQSSDPSGAGGAGEADASPQGGDSAGDVESVEQGLAEAQSSVEDMRQSVSEAAGSAGEGEAASAADEASQNGGEETNAASTGEASDGSGRPIDMPDFNAQGGSADRGIELLGDVDLDVSIELGRSEMLVEDVLRLGAGSVVELDKLAGDPVDVYVNSRLVARGEVLVLNDNFCIRISEIVANLEEEADLAAQQSEDG
jgi:flagellar motor switch protein FliN/FliY